MKLSAPEVPWIRDLHLSVLQKDREQIPHETDVVGQRYGNTQNQSKNKVKNTTSIILQEIIIFKNSQRNLENNPLNT